MVDEATVVPFPHADERQIVAFGGGGFSMEAGNPLLDDYVLDLARARGSAPRVCFLPTASGDADHYIVRFYRAFSGDICEPSHVSLFRRDRGADDLREHILSQDLIYVGGRQRDQPARNLEGTWDRLDPGRGLASRRDPLRPQRRIALLVLGGRHVLPRRGPAGAGPGPVALEQLRPLRQQAGSPRALPPDAQSGHVPGVCGRGRQRSAFPRLAGSSPPSPPAPRPGVVRG